MRHPDVVAAARSARFAKRIKVEEFSNWCPQYCSVFSTFVFTVTVRWPEGDVAGCGGPLPDSWRGHVNGSWEDQLESCVAEVT